jgi:hypothetical protein
LSLRVTPELKNRLDFAAYRSGRSQSQEAELRLERTFDRTDLLPEVLSLAYSRKMAGVLMMLGRVMGDAGFCRLVDHRDQRHWTDHPEAYDQALLAAAAVLNELRGPGSHARPQTVELARQIVRAVRGARTYPNRVDRHELKTIRSLLGSAEPMESQSEPVRRRKDLSIEASKAATEIVALINAQPGTPSQQSIAEVVLTSLRRTA